jgi:dipeptidyl aminopeptidase/acylaminoacyl peptidase
MKNIKGIGVVAFSCLMSPVLNAVESNPIFQYCIGSSFLPDNSSFTYVSNLAGNAGQLWWKPIGSYWPKQLTNFDEHIYKTEWNKAKKKIALEVGLNGSDERVILIGDPFKNSFQKVSPSGQISRLQSWTKDGTGIIYSTLPPDEKGVNLFIFDTKEQKTLRLTESPYYESLQDENEHGYLYWQLFQRSDENLLLKTGSDTRTLISHEEGMGTIWKAQLLNNGDVLAATDMYTNRHSLVLIDNKDDTQVIIEKPDKDLVDINVSPNGKLLFAHWKSYSLSSFTILDIESFKVVYKSELPLGTIYRNEWSHDSRYVSFQFVDDSNNIYVLDMNELKLTKETHCQPSSNEEPIPTEHHLFKSFDGLQLDGWLKRANPEPSPTVIYFHGGPERESTFSGTTDMDKLLIEAGINVFYPNIRGSSGRGKEFVTLDNKEKRFDAYKDSKAVYDFLVESGIAQADKIAVMGSSYGGTMTNASVAFFPDLFVTGISMYGHSDFLSNRSWFTHLSSNEYGHPESDKDLLREISPLSYAERVKVPMLFIHGANDTNTPLQQSTMFKERLDELGLETRIIVFDDEGHGIVKQNNRKRLNKEIRDWLIEHFKKID